MSFKLVVKNSYSSYGWNSATSEYGKGKMMDDVLEYDSLAEAVAEFLYHTMEAEDKVTLTFIPEKKSKKDKKG